jgi:hypothetical protein
MCSVSLKGSPRGDAARSDHASHLQPKTTETCPILVTAHQRIDDCIRWVMLWRNRLA